MNSERVLVTFDTAYSLNQYNDGALIEFQKGKLLNGYFDKLLVVNIASNINKKLSAPGVIGKCKLVNFIDSNDSIEYLDVPFGRFHFLKKFQKVNFFCSLISTLLTIINLGKKNNYLFVRGEDPHLNGFLALVVAKYFKVPSLIGVWGNPDEIRKDTGLPLFPRLFKFKKIEIIFEKFVLKMANRVLVQNENNKNFVVNVIKSDKKIRFFRVSVQLEDIHYSDPTYREKPKNFFNEFDLQSEKKMLCIARLEEEKRVLDTIKVLSILINQKLIKVDLFICGVGEQEESLKRFAREEGILKYIHFCGLRSQTWLSTAIPMMDLYVTPISGRALVEVALGGLAVVTYDRDWQSEIIEHDVTGYICKFKDIKAFADLAFSALQNKEKSIEMGAALRNYALQEFSKERALIIEQACYEEL